MNKAKKAAADAASVPTLSAETVEKAVQAMKDAAKRLIQQKKQAKLASTAPVEHETVKVPKKTTKMDPMRKIKILAEAKIKTNRMIKDAVKRW